MSDTAIWAACSGRGWTLRDRRIRVCACGTYDPPKWVTRGDTPCLIPHYRDPERPRRASVGYTCNGHRDKIEQMLAELPSLHDDLAAMLTASEKPNTEGGRPKHGQVTGGMNLNKFVVDAREEIHAECVRLVRWICEEKPACDPPGRWVVKHLPVGVHGPVNIIWQDAPDTVSAIASWLLGQVDWLCARLDVDDTHDNLDRLTRDARRLAYPTGRRKIEVGPCGDGDCPGVLWLIGKTDEERAMSCDDCKRSVEPRYWRRERRRIDGVDANPWLTLTEAAVQYGTTTRTVERWVAKGRLKSRGSPMRVKASAVEALMRVFVGQHSA